MPCGAPGPRSLPSHLLRPAPPYPTPCRPALSQLRSSSSLANSSGFLHLLLHHLLTISSGGFLHLLHHLLPPPASPSDNLVGLSSSPSSPSHQLSKLEICTRNLGRVQQFAALSTLESISEMNDRRRIRTGFRGDLHEEEVICPKPRRVTNVSCPAPEFLKPSRRRKSIATQVRPEGEAGFEILDIFLSRSGFGDSSNFGCSPPYFCGSPPSRSGNPLIHDVQFVQPRIPSAQSSLSSLVSQQKSSCGPSYGGSPSIRVEGFASSAESRCSVSALA